jgi:mandelate racemase
MATDYLTLRSLSSTAVMLPMTRPLGTSAQKIDAASLLLVDLETHEGVG